MATSAPVPNERDRFKNLSQNTVNLGKLQNQEAANAPISSSQQAGGEGVLEDVSPQGITQTSARNNKYHGSNLGARVGAEGGNNKTGSSADAANETRQLQSRNEIGEKDQRKASQALQKRRVQNLKKKRKNNAKKQKQQARTKTKKKVKNARRLISALLFFIANFQWIAVVIIVIMALMVFGYKYPLTAKFAVNAATISTKFTIYAFEKFITTFVL